MIWAFVVRYAHLTSFASKTRIRALPCGRFASERLRRIATAGECVSDEMQRKGDEMQEGKKNSVPKTDTAYKNCHTDSQAVKAACQIISLQNEALSSFEFFGNLGDFRWKFRKFSVVGQNRRVQHGFD